MDYNNFYSGGRVVIQDAAISDVLMTLMDCSKNQV